MNEYLLPFTYQSNSLINDLLIKLEEYAKEYEVPIVTKDSLQVIKSLIVTSKATRILEIGTAIGYSALNFSYLSDNILIDTIERDSKMYETALKNVKEHKKEKQINIHFVDALELDISLLNNEYDLLFIDAAKAQSIKFFEKFSPLIKSGGLIITDNILFHGCLENQTNLSKNVLHMVKKIDKYNHYLKELKDYQTFFVDCGDGLAITYKE